MLTISWTRPDSISLVECVGGGSRKVVRTAVEEVRLVSQSYRIQYYCLARGRSAYDVTPIVDQNAG
jgi:hypothetical protein